MVATGPALYLPSQMVEAAPQFHRTFALIHHNGHPPRSLSQTFGLRGRRGSHRCDARGIASSHNRPPNGYPSAHAALVLWQMKKIITSAMAAHDQATTSAPSPSLLVRGDRFPAFSKMSRIMRTIPALIRVKPRPRATRIGSVWAMRSMAA